MKRSMEDIILDGKMGLVQPTCNQSISKAVSCSLSLSDAVLVQPSDQNNISWYSCDEALSWQYSSHCDCCPLLGDVIGEPQMLHREQVEMGQFSLLPAHMICSCSFIYLIHTSEQSGPALQFASNTNVKCSCRKQPYPYVARWSAKSVAVRMIG